MRLLTAPLTRLDLPAFALPLPFCMFHALSDVARFDEPEAGLKYSSIPNTLISRPTTLLVASPLTTLRASHDRQDALELLVVITQHHHSY
jgi:hypothetical protein